MPFTTENYNHLAPVMEFSGGPTTGLFENIGAAFSRQHDVESFQGYTSRMVNAYRENMRLAAEAYGKAVSSEQLFKPDSSMAILAATTRAAGGAVPHNIGINRYLEEIDKVDKIIEELRTDPTNSNLKTFKELMDDEVRYRKGLIERSASVYSRADPLGMLGAFAGGMAGSLDPRVDPIYAGSMFLGPGAGRHIITKIVTDAFVAGAAESVQQFGFVDPQHKLFNEPSDPLTAVIFAAVGGAAFRGVTEAGGPAFRALEAKIAPQRAAARIISGTIEDALGKPIDFSQARRRLTDQELLDAVKKLKQTEDVTNVRTQLERDIITAEGSPYPNTRDGRLQTEQELARALQAFEGDTALGLSIPRELLDDNPLVRATTPEELLARADHPAIYAELDRLAAELQDAQARTRELETQLNERSVGDVVTTIDDASGQRVKAIEAELDKPITRERRTTLEGELDQIIQSIGPEVITKKAQENRIAPKKEIDRSRATAKRIRRELARVRQRTTRLEDIERGRMNVRRALAEEPRSRFEDSARLVEKADELITPEATIKHLEAANESLPKPPKAISPEERTAAAIKIIDAADATLTDELNNIVTQFVAHDRGAKLKGEASAIMNAGPLEALARGETPELAKAMEEAFKPVKEELRLLYGDRVPLYRVQYPVSDNVAVSFPKDGKRAVLSWTADEQFAKHYAGVAKELVRFDEETILRLAADFEKTKEISIPGTSYRLKFNSQYKNFSGDLVDSIDIFDGNEHITDTESVHEFLTSLNEQADELIARNKVKEARILMAEVPLDEIIWATDRAGQLEFLVKNDEAGALFVDKQGKLIETPQSPIEVDIAGERIRTDLAVPDGENSTRSVADILEDLNNDEALLKASQECAL